MLRLLRQLGRAPPISGHVPDGLRVYAIGDVHGRLDLLDRLIKLMEEDHSKRPPARTQVIFLGDLIDRGPDSARVIERAIQLHRAAPNTRFLMGNHEEMLLRVLAGDVAKLSGYTHHGGLETFFSYGITEEDYNTLDGEELIAAVQRHVPPRHLEFLSAFEDVVEVGDYAFVHAGVRPGVPLAEQQGSDLRWIRNEFLHHGGAFERIIVHGHTISREVEWRANRIGIDTGAYASGKLTALVLDGSERWALST